MLVSVRKALVEKWVSRGLLWSLGHWLQQSWEPRHDGLSPSEEGNHYWHYPYHAQGKEMQKSKMFVWGGFTMSWGKKRRKGKGEKERYIHLNAEFQRLARREKKGFLGEQCKEVEKNNRIGKTGNLFKKIRDTKRAFHTKMGSIKDRNGMDLTEAEDIKKRWQ